MSIERGKLKACSSQLTIRETELTEAQQLLDQTNKKLKEASLAKQILEEQSAELKTIIAKLEENLVKKERLLERKEDAINKANANVESLRTVCVYHRFVNSFL